MTVNTEDYSKYKNLDTSKYQDKAKDEQTVLRYIQQWGSKTGRELLTDVLWLWYSKDSLPVGAIAIALGAIGYFVAPVDLIPDAIPVAGFLDDGAVIAGAIKALSGSLPQEARVRAEAQVEKLLGKKPEGENVIEAEVIEESAA